MIDNSQRRILHGIAASGGRAIAPAARVIRPVTSPGDCILADDPVAERQKFDRAVDAVCRHLIERAQGASGVGRTMLEMTSMIASDPTLLHETHCLIDEKQLCAKSAVWSAATLIAGRLKDQGGRVAERATDVMDVRDRIIAELSGLPQPGIPTITTPHVLVADDLSPADTATLDPMTVSGIVLAHGGPTSHTAILARELGIPAVVGLGSIDSIGDGQMIAVDGTSGDVHLDPVDDAEFLRPRQRVTAYQGGGRLKDGTPISLLANVADLDGARLAVSLGADGIGLLRTEYVFPPLPTPPSREEQRSRYREIFAIFAHGPVIVRTLDAGADKPLPFLTQTSTEANPALGMRGWRAYADHWNVLEDQLAAIGDAAADTGTDVWVMVPMISTARQTIDFMEAGRAAGLSRLGVMIEVPAAAISSRHILAHADFASIGTNDLTQYTMAADRGVGELAELNNPWQPAVLDLIRHAVWGGNANNAPVSVCGEAAADPALAAVLLGFGASSLSMAPRSLARVNALLAQTTMDECAHAAEAALAEDSADAARAAARRALSALPEG